MSDFEQKPTRADWWMRTLVVGFTLWFLLDAYWLLEDCQMHHEFRARQQEAGAS